MLRASPKQQLSTQFLFDSEERDDINIAHFSGEALASQETPDAA
jgi:hypothetical protein